MPLNPAPAPGALPDAERALLASRFAAVWAHSRALAAPLSAEDQCVQSMPDASPTKWHLAHTTWFFEALVLAVHATGYQPFDSRWFHLFNSYYEALGPGMTAADRLVVGVEQVGEGRVEQPIVGGVRVEQERLEEPTGVGGSPARAPGGERSRRTRSCAPGATWPATHRASIG